MSVTVLTLLFQEMIAGIKRALNIQSESVPVFADRLKGIFARAWGVQRRKSQDLQEMELARNETDTVGGI